MHVTPTPRRGELAPHLHLGIGRRRSSHDPPSVGEPGLRSAGDRSRTIAANDGTLLQDYVLRQHELERREITLGFVRLHRDKATAAYWLHERMHGCVTATRSAGAVM